jgi:hypothetical protein
MPGYIPGQGFKKPINQLQGQVFPQIRKAPDRFVSAGKYWVVDVGSTLVDSVESQPQRFEHCTLIQSRSYPETIYGKSSHRDVVNKAFRPPLLGRDDYLPLSRLPRNEVVPRVNPGTDGENRQYEVNNSWKNGTSKHIQYGVKDATWRPTVLCPYAPIEQTSRIIPDLELVLPPISAASNSEVPFRPAMEINMNKSIMEDPKLRSALYSGFETQLTVDGEVVHPHPESVPLNRPQPSVTAGANVEHYTPIGPQPDMVYKKDVNKVSTSVTSGQTSSYRTGTVEPEYLDRTPEYTRPQTAVSAGQQTFLTVDGYNAAETQHQFETKLGTDLITTPEYDYRYDNYSITPTKVYDQIIPSYSVQVQPEVMYRAPNERTAQPHFREKLQVHGSNGAYGYHPKAGLTPLRVQLKEAHKF